MPAYTYGVFQKASNNETRSIKNISLQRHVERYWEMELLKYVDISFNRYRRTSE